jgi:hypothetical protein
MGGGYPDVGGVEKHQFVVSPLSKAAEVAAMD